MKTSYRLIDDAASEVVWAAQRVYVMTTPEIFSLDLARQPGPMD